MKLTVVLVFALITIMMMFICHHYYLNAVLWQEKAEKLLESSQQQEKKLVLLRHQQQDIAELDRFYMEKLNEADKDNKNLHARLSAGSHGMCIKGARVRKHKRSTTTTTGSVGHDTSIELSSDIGQNILSIREGIIQDQQKLMYLQDYINRTSPTIINPKVKNGNE